MGFFAEDGLYTWSAPADSDDPNAGATPDVVLGTDLPGAMKVRTGRSAGAVDGDARRITYVELELDADPPLVTEDGVQVYPDHQFRRQPDGPTVRVTTVNQDADWLFNGSLRLEVRVVG